MIELHVQCGECNADIWPSRPMPRRSGGEAFHTIRRPQLAGDCRSCGSRILDVGIKVLTKHVKGRSSEPQ